MTASDLKPFSQGQVLDAKSREILLQTAAQAAAVPAQELTLAKRRQLMLDARVFLPSPPVLGMRSQDLAVNLAGRSLPARLYTPQSISSDVLVVFFHGGGWVLGDLATHDAACVFLAHELGMKLLSVEYRKAPEHAFPAPCDDAEDTLVWAQAQARHWGCTRLAVAGDSAGGHLAAVAMHKHPALVSAALLIYPVTDMLFGSTSYTERGAGPGLTRDAMRWYWQQFIDPNAALPGQRSHDPRAVPMLQHWRQAAPASVVIAAWHDPLFDEAVTYAQHLAASGAQVALHQAGDMAHGFLRHFNGVPSAKAHMLAAIASFKKML